MCKLTILLGALALMSAFSVPSNATSLTMQTEVTVLANVLFLSREAAQQICEINPDIKNCSVVIVRNEEDESLEARANFIDIAKLQRDEYPVRMLNFE